MSRIPSVLEDLVAPHSREEFLSLLAARRLTLMRGVEPDRFRPLLDWQTLAGLIARGEHPMSLAEFCVTRDSAVVPPENWLRRDPANGQNRVELARIEGFMRQGFSLVIQPIDRHAPALGRLCESIRAVVPERIKEGVIVTEGRHGAFRLHYDPEDLIILQVEGSKRWRIVGPAVANPVIGMRAPPAPDETNILFDDVLHAGDALYVPAGNWHRCEGGPGRSMHLSIFLTPPTAWHALCELTEAMLADDLFARPATRLASPDDLAALEAEVKTRAIARIQEMEMGDVLKAWASRR